MTEEDTQEAGGGGQEEGAGSPLRALREQVRSLEAAILETLAEPEEEPVHRLRTGTRRTEAQLQLLLLLMAEVPTVANAKKQIKKLGQRLDEVRRAAGKVRDIDVQRSMLKEIRETCGAGGDSIHAQIHSVRHELKHTRVSEAAQLSRVLGRLEKKLVRQMQTLFQALEPANDLTVPPERLQVLVRDWYAQRRVQAGGAEKSAALHELRKAAKLARYLMEGQAQTASSQEAAGQMEELGALYQELQKAGGTWHDLLLLRKTAGHALGKQSALVQHLSEQQGVARRAYQQQLQHFAL